MGATTAAIWVGSAFGLHEYLQNERENILEDYKTELVEVDLFTQEEADLILDLNYDRYQLPIDADDYADQLSTEELDRLNGLEDKFESYRGWTSGEYNTPLDELKEGEDEDNPGGEFLLAYPGGGIVAVAGLAALQVAGGALVFVAAMGEAAIKSGIKTGKKAKELLSKN